MSQPVLNRMARFLKLLALSLASMVSIVTISPAVHAAGDLLVAPTRLVLNGKRGTEVILNNIGSETATYRISLELRRMTEEGGLKDISKEDANAIEQAALSMIRYAPRRVTLPPNQPQAIRIAARTPPKLPDGEYRVHLLFRAIPKARPVTKKVEDVKGFRIALTPVYGVTIPLIIRKGKLKATAGISNARLVTRGDKMALEFDLAREGEGSIYGEIKIRKQGVDDPLFRASGIAVYPEIDRRKVSFPVPKRLAASLKGPVSIEFYKHRNAGGGLITKTQTVLQ